MKKSISLLVISSFLVSPLLFSSEIKKPNSFCEVMSNYGAQAAHEKIANQEMSKDDAFTMMIYGLSRTEDFGVLSEKEKESFSNVIYDIYNFVYSEKDINEENATEKTYQFCLSRTDLAWSKIISNVNKCQIEGEVYELASMLRDTGRTEVFAREIIKRDSKSEKDKEIALKAISKAYSNKKTPEENGKDAYERCLKE